MTCRNITFYKTSWFKSLIWVPMSLSDVKAHTSVHYRKLQVTQIIGLW